MALPPIGESGRRHGSRGRSLFKRGLAQCRWGRVNQTLPKQWVGIPVPIFPHFHSFLLTSSTLPPLSLFFPLFLITPTVALGEIPSTVPLLPTSDIATVAAPMAQVPEGLAGGPDLSNWMNLLLPNREALKQPRVFVGEGFPTIPKRLYEKILRWEFVDFADLRPPGSLETINPDTDPQKLIVLPGLEVAKAKKKPVQDIRVWTQCFALYATVLIKRYPETVADLMAYLSLIVQAHRDYEDPAWQRYDEAFRDKAAATGNRKWSSLDPHLYNKICAGRARKVCLDTSSPAMEKGAGDPTLVPPPKRPARELGRSWGGKSQPPRGYKSNTCWDWNMGACKFNPCKYRHMCSDCGGRHPQLQCRQGGEATSGGMVGKKQPMIRGAKDWESDK